MNDSQKTSILNEGYSNQPERFEIKAAKDCYLYDTKGFQYIDMAMAGGSALLGHANPIINDAITRQLPNGTLFTVANNIASDYINYIHQALPHYHDYVFCNTGSEATLRAIRIARAFTKRTKIAMFSGGWHGSHDLLLFDEDYSGSGSNPFPKAILKSAGTPQSFLKDILLLPYNDDTAFELINTHSDELAMVIIEPVQGSNPREDIGEFLKSLRQITQRHNILLCFDEVITGCRLAFGGGQEFFNVKADLATYGKAIGGGLPIGLIAGNDDVMGCIRNPKDPVFMGGTFSANPLTLAAGKAMLNELLSHPEIYLKLNDMGDFLRDNINQFCHENNIQAHMMGVGSMSRLVFCKKPIASRKERELNEVAWDKQNLFYSMLKDFGVYVGGNRINFISTAHDKQSLQEVINAYCKALNIWHKQGIL